MLFITASVLFNFVEHLFDVYYCEQCDVFCLSFFEFVFFFSSRRRHTRCALVTGVQTCALPICSVGERRVADEGIRPPFVREIAVRAVAGQEDGVAAERPQLPRDRIEQLPVVAARKVRAADRTLEQHVADDRQLRRRVVEDDMARRVPRTMDDIEGQVADRHRIAVVQPAVGFERLAAHPEAGTVLAQPLDPETVVLVRSEEHTSELQSLMRTSYAVFCLKKKNTKLKQQKE